MAFDQYEVDDLDLGSQEDIVSPEEMAAPSFADTVTAPDIQPVQPTGQNQKINFQQYDVRQETVAPSDPQDEYVKGMHSADRDGTGKKKSALLFTILFWGGAGITLLVLGWFLFSPYLKNFKKTEADPLKAVEEARYKDLLKEREEMAKRLSIAEDKLSLEKKAMDDKFERMLKSIQEADAQRAAAQMERDRLIREEMQKLLEQRKADGKPVVEIPAKTEPLKGNSAKMRTFDTITPMMERRTAEAEALAEASRHTMSARIHTGAGLRTAAMIPAVLKTRIVSLYQRAGLEHWIVAETTNPITIPEGIIPAGTRFLGKSTADYQARRMTVEIERMQVGTTDIEMRGVMLDHRGNVGMVTKYVDPKQQAMWSSLLPNLLSAAARASQDLITDEYRDDKGRTYREQKPEFSGRNVALEAAAETMENQAKIMQDIASEKMPIIIVEQGIPVLIQLTDRIPLELLIEARVIEFKN